MINFDCHAHVYEQVRAIPNARYVPKSAAPLSDWRAHHLRHGIMGGVIVQVSFLGTDNSELCDALAQLDPARFAGVAVTALDVSDETLAQLRLAGVRGVRWNLVRGAALPDLSDRTVQEFLGKLRRADLHLEIHLEGPRLAPYLPALTDQGVKVVVDHFGLPSDPDPTQDPLIKSVTGLSDPTALYIKLAAHYRTGFDLRPHTQSLLSTTPPEKFVWGSDWPHTQHETVVDYDAVTARLHDWGLTSDKAAVRDLYGLTAADESKPAQD